MIEVQPVDYRDPERRKLTVMQNKRLQRVFVKDGYGYLVLIHTAVWDNYVIQNFLPDMLQKYGPETAMLRATQEFYNHFHHLYVCLN